MGKFILLCLFILSSNITYAQCTNDNVPPHVVVSGKPIDIYLNQAGQVWVYGYQLDSASTDNCGIARRTINGLDSMLFDCGSLGNQIIFFEVFDSSNNSAVSPVLLKFRDTLVPQASCQNHTVYLDNAGVATVTADDINFFSIDNCGISTKEINGQQSIQFTCDSVATSPHIATLTLTDASGEQATCQSIITVVDNINPTAQCLNTISVVLDSSGVGSIPAIAFDDGSYDNCSPLNYQVNGNASWTYNCFNVGANNTVVLSAMDASGNLGNCVTTVQVLDNIAPVIQCQAVTIFINGNGNASVGAADLAASSTDNCGIYSMTFGDGNPIKNFTCTDTGVHTVTLLVQDVNGNVSSTQTTVTVRDTTPPTVFCYSININLTNNASLTLTPGDVGVAYDNCSLGTMLITPSTITCNEIGKTPFTLTVEDNHGNITTCIDTAYVSAAPPTITNHISNIPTTLCIGDTLELLGAVPSTGLVYTTEWIGPAGTISLGSTSASVDGISIADEGYYYFSVTPNNGGCMVSDSFYLEVDNCLVSSAPADLDEKSDIRLFPNPAQDFVTIQSNSSTLLTVELRTVEGRLISIFEPSQQKMTEELDLSQLPNAVYLVTVRTETGVHNERVILQR